MKNHEIYLIANGIMFLYLIFMLIKNHKKEMKLLRAMDFFKPENSVSVKDELVIPLEFTQDYSKDVDLLRAVKKNKDYYDEEVARLLAIQLIKNKAVNIEYIKGFQKDTIKASIKYVIDF
jgi:hypothetical protein